MVLIHNALINNIKRAEAAYRVYQKGLKYHQALNVYHANKKVYDELNHLLNDNNMDATLNKKVFNYLFYLEDWFLQFSKLEKEVNDPEDRFLLTPLKNSMLYPADFLRDIVK